MSCKAAPYRAEHEISVWPPWRWSVLKHLHCLLHEVRSSAFLWHLSSMITMNTKEHTTKPIPTFPDVGLVSAIMAFSVVDFPAPFGPSRPKISPASTAKLLSTTATLTVLDLSRFRPRHLGRPRLYCLCKFFTVRTAAFMTDTYTPLLP